MNCSNRSIHSCVLMFMICSLHEILKKRSDCTKFPRSKQIDKFADSALNLIIYVVVVYQGLRAPILCERGRPLLQPQFGFSRAAVLKRQARTTSKERTIRSMSLSALPLSECPEPSAIAISTVVSSCRRVLFKEKPKFCPPRIWNAHCDL